MELQTDDESAATVLKRKSCRCSTVLLIKKLFY